MKVRLGFPSLVPWMLQGMGLPVSWVLRLEAVPWMLHWGERLHLLVPWMILLGLSLNWMVTPMGTRKVPWLMMTSVPWIRKRLPGGASWWKGSKYFKNG